MASGDCTVKLIAQIKTRRVLSQRLHPQIPRRVRVSHLRLSQQTTHAKTTPRRRALTRLQACLFPRRAPVRSLRRTSGSPQVSTQCRLTRTNHTPILILRKPAELWSVLPRVQTMSSRLSKQKTKPPLAVWTCRARPSAFQRRGSMRTALVRAT